MIIDNIINDIDSNLFHTAEYDGHELELYTNGNRRVEVYDVEEIEFIKLQRNPTHEACENLMQKHGYKIFGC